MNTRTITIEHNGREYLGQIMAIKSTRLGYEDHGILTAMLDLRDGSSGVGVGGYCLDTPVRDENDRSTGERRGTAYGLDHIAAIMRTVGVSTWEKLPGQHVIVLYEGAAGWGGASVGIASLTGDRVLILKDHAEEWRAREALEQVP